ncbi:MAG: hypothetical protein ACTHON_18240 [Humibacter sp.]
MPKYRVPMTTWANATVDVETDETDPEKIFELATEGAPSICAQCSGWGRKHSLEIGDDWEPATDEEGGASVYELKDTE